MRRLCAYLLLLTSAVQASEDPNATLQRARKAVAAQLARAANYGCVQTIDRQYLIGEQAGPRGCTRESSLESEFLWMHDRLRLDIAVSEGREIYSWHGAAQFTSSDVSDVVQTGPISSGNFTGFLRNIFVDPGAQFTYTDETEFNGLKTYHFNFVMPHRYSVYRVQAKTGKPTVPYHGSFSIAESDAHLTQLQVVGDAIPSDSPICSAETTITYQFVSVSGTPSLVPASFVLDLRDEWHVHTISGSNYSQCREFRGESTLHFDLPDSSAPESARDSKVQASLPAGLSLQIALRTPIDSRTSYIGDPVQGVLSHPFRVPGTETIVPKGAVLEGIITKLEDYYRPTHFQLCSVKFNRLNFGKHLFVLSASPRTSAADESALRHLYGLPLPALVADAERKGLFVLRSSHLHLDRRFSAQWVTSTPASNDVISSSSR